MTAIVTIVAFLVLLGILVVAHELGHFWSARAFRIDVEEFGIGMPPRAWTFAERNGVKYTLNWLPLGGFVRFRHRTVLAAYAKPPSFIVSSCSLLVPS